MINDLLLLSKNDIPFIEAQVNIHQPTIKEISLIGEEEFYTGYQFLTFNKNQLSKEDRDKLKDKTDFEVLIILMHNAEQRKYRDSAINLLTLLFPNYEVKLESSEIILRGSSGIVRLNSGNFNKFKEILTAMFDIEDSKYSSSSYNPADARAAKIAEKFKQAKMKRKGGKSQKIAVLSRYISILSVGLQKDMNDLLEYSVYQLKDEFTRYQKKTQFDVYMQAKMLGAKNLDDIDNWMDDIHS